jgi:MFS family permease
MNVSREYREENVGATGDDASVSTTAYRRVLTLPGVPQLLGFAVLARIPRAGATVVLTLYVVLGLDRSYGAAGLVSAFFTVGVAVGAPWRGRALDRLGVRRALLPSVLVEGSAWFIVPVVGFHALFPVVFVAGLMSVPIFTVIRQSLAVLVPLSHQHTAYALDSIGTELTFMTGPAVAVLLVTQWSPTGAVFTIGATLVLAGLAIMIFNPPTRSPVDPAVEAPAEDLANSEPSAGSGSSLNSGSSAVSAGTSPAGAARSPAESGTLLRDPALLAVLAVATGALAVLAATDVSIVAHARADGQIELTWLVFVVWSLPSLIGGLVFGAIRRAVSPYALLLGLGLLTIPVGFAPNVWWLMAALVPAGFLCAPTLSATASAISRLVPENRRGEAMGWYGSALTLGMAAGTPIAGTAIDLAGPWAGFTLLGGVGVVVALIGLVLIPWGTDRPGSFGPGAPSGVSPTRGLTVSN